MIEKLIAFSARNAFVVILLIVGDRRRRCLGHQEHAHRRDPGPVRRAGHHHRELGRAEPDARRGPGHLPDRDRAHLGAEREGRARLLVLRRVVRVRDLRGRHRPLLGAQPRARVPERPAGPAARGGARRCSGRTPPASAGPSSTRSSIERARTTSAGLRTLNDWYVQYQLRSVTGVAEVAPVGGFVKQYQIEVDPNALLAYNMPIDKVVAAVRASNNDVGGRVVEWTGREYMVRGLGYIQSVADIEQVSLGSRPDGTPILVRDVARVHLGPEMRRGVADLNGEGDVAGGIVVIRYGVDTNGVIQNIKKAVKEKIQPVTAEGRRVRHDLRPIGPHRAIDQQPEGEADRGSDHRLARVHRLPLALPERAGRDPDAAARDPALVHGDALHRARLEHHEPGRHRDRHRRDDRRGDHHDRERAQASRARPGGQAAARRPHRGGAGSRPAAVLLAADHHRLVPADLHARGARKAGCSARLRSPRRSPWDSRR